MLFCLLPNWAEWRCWCALWLFVSIFYQKPDRYYTYAVNMLIILALGGWCPGGLHSITWYCLGCVMLMRSCHVMRWTCGDVHLKVMKTEADGLFSVNRDSKTVHALHLDGIKANLAGGYGFFSQRRWTWPRSGVSCPYSLAALWGLSWPRVAGVSGPGAEDMRTDSELRETHPLPARCRGPLLCETQTGVCRLCDGWPRARWMHRVGRGSRTPGGGQDGSRETI